MKLGINNGIWEVKGIKFEEAITKISNFGFKYVDILALGSVNPLFLNAKDKSSIIKKFNRADLTSSNMVMLPEGNIATPDKKERQECLLYLKSCADFQKELGGRQVLIGKGCGSKTYNTSFEQAWVNSADLIRDYCGYLYDLNMFLTLEMDPYVFYMVNNTYRMLKMIETIGAPNLFLNMDIGHLAITREPPVELRKLQNSILHIHISDNNGIIHSNAIIGSGTALIKEYLNELIDLNVEGVCNKSGEVLVAALELGEFGQDIKDIDFYISKSIEFIKNNIPEILM